MKGPETKSAPSSCPAVWGRLSDLGIEKSLDSLLAYEALARLAVGHYPDAAPTVVQGE